LSGSDLLNVAQSFVCRTTNRPRPPVDPLHVSPPPAPCGLYFLQLVPGDYRDWFVVFPSGSRWLPRFFLPKAIDLLPCSRECSIFPSLSPPYKTLRSFLSERSIREPLLYPPNSFSSGGQVPRFCTIISLAWSYWRDLSAPPPRPLIGTVHVRILAIFKILREILFRACGTFLLTFASLLPRDLLNCLDQTVMTFRKPLFL